MIHDICHVTFYVFYGPENLIGWYSSDVSKTKPFSFLSIYMGASSFVVETCIEVKCLVFMWLFFMCYPSFLVKVYTLATMIGMESYFFKILFKLPSTFLGYAKKPLRRCVATNTLQKRGYWNYRRVNEILALLIALFLVNFQLFQNTHRKHFYGSLFLLKSQILNTRPVKLDKKGQRFYKRTKVLIFWTFPEKYLQ